MKKNYGLTPTLSVWPLRGHTALKSIFLETLFLDQLHDFLLLSLNSFLHPFLKSKFIKKTAKELHTSKKEHFGSLTLIDCRFIYENQFKKTKSHASDLEIGIARSIF